MMRLPLSTTRVPYTTLFRSSNSAQLAAKKVGTASAGSTAISTAYTTANITPFTLIVTFKGVNRIYDASKVATVTESDNHFAGDDVTVSNGGAYFDDKNVGTAKRVTVTAVSIGGGDA